MHKVGQLVELSTKGKKIKYHIDYSLRENIDQIGIVLKHHRDYSRDFYEVYFYMLEKNIYIRGTYIKKVN